MYWTIGFRYTERLDSREIFWGKVCVFDVFLMLFTGNRCAGDFGGKSVSPLPRVCQRCEQKPEGY